MSLCLPVRDSLTFPPESASLPSCAIVTRKWRAKEQSQLAPSSFPDCGRAIRGRAKCFTPSTHSCSGRSVAVARGLPASPSFLPLSPSLSLAFLTPYFISGGGGGAAAVYRVRPPKSRDMKYNRAIRAHVFFRELLFRTSHSHSLTTRPPRTNRPHDLFIPEREEDAPRSQVLCFESDLFTAVPRKEGVLARFLLSSYVRISFFPFERASRLAVQKVPCYGQFPSADLPRKHKNGAE